MKFLADEGVDRSIVEGLRKLNFDVYYVVEKIRSLNDDVLLQIAFEKTESLLQETRTLES